MLKISGKFIGNKKIELLHEQSGTKLITAAPLDNNGDGSSFSPTDLLAAGLASCLLTIAAIVADKKGYDISGSSFDVEKIMSSTPPRRIAEIIVKIKLPSSLTQEQRQLIEEACLKCPAHKSLHPEVKTPIEFIYC